MEKLILENTFTEDELTEAEKVEQREKAKKIHEEETARAQEREKKLASYNISYDEAKSGLKEHNPVPYDEAYAEAKKGLKPDENNPNYRSMAKILEKQKESPTYNETYEEAVRGLKPDENNPDYKPMATEIFSFDFAIDPAYSFEQREKIEHYTESLIKEIEEIQKAGKEADININFVINEKKKELEEIARVAKKKRLFAIADNRMLNSLEYVGDPENNAQVIINRLKSQE